MVTVIKAACLAAAFSGTCQAFSSPAPAAGGLSLSSRHRRRRQSSGNSALHLSAEPTRRPKLGNLHGEGSCFMPVLQNNEEYIAPRIVQIAGGYPGVTAEEFLAVSSEPAAELGHWSYDFSDPDGPQMGTVAIPGQATSYKCIDPVAIIAEHFSLNVQLPPELVDPVDLIVLCDRDKTHFAERRFLVLDGVPGFDGELSIASFPSKGDLPEGSRILGHVELVQIPWLPCMTKTRSGFSEEDELF